MSVFINIPQDRYGHRETNHPSHMTRYLDARLAVERLPKWQAGLAAKMAVSHVHHEHINTEQLYIPILTDKDDRGVASEK